MNKLIIGFLFLTFLIGGCKTVVPERDSVSPTFLLRIQNREGFLMDIPNTFDFDNTTLYLERGKTYQIVYTGGDNGGLEFLSWRFSSDGAFRVRNSFAGSCTIENFNSDELRILCQGDRNDPRTGLVITADLEVYGLTTSTVEEYEFKLESQDYFANSTAKILAIRIHNDAPRIGNR
jgi:hypothetical protein